METLNIEISFLDTERMSKTVKRLNIGNTSESGSVVSVVQKCGAKMLRKWDKYS